MRLELKHVFEELFSSREFRDEYASRDFALGCKGCE
jgi:hypothetical protein